MKALVLMSGGIDSTVCATMAAQEHGNENVIGLTVLYGQKHSREVKAAHAVAKKLLLGDILRIDLPLFDESRCALTNAEMVVPETTYEKVREAQGVSPMYVPFRNGLFLSAAAAMALQLDCEVIYFGAHSEDARNWAYPDCTPEFNGSISSAIYIGTYHKVRVITPLQWMTKSQIVNEGVQIDAPLQLTYSCYVGGINHCGTCATCVSRINAFKSNGLIDKVDYEIDVDWGFQRIF